MATLSLGPRSARTAVPFPSGVWRERVDLNTWTLNRVGLFPNSVEEVHRAVKFIETESRIVRTNLEKREWGVNV